MLHWLIERAVAVNQLVGMIAFCVFLIFLFILMPLSFFKKCRHFCSVSFFAGSYLFGFSLWLTSALLTLYFLGPGWLIAGLFLCGIGVVPIAFIGLLINAQWSNLLFLAIMVIIVFSFGIYGLFLINKSAETASAGI